MATRYPDSIGVWFQEEVRMSDETEIVWSDPPSQATRVSGRVPDAEMSSKAEVLRSAEGQWARIIVKDSKTKAHSTATRIRTAKSRAFAPARSFDTRVGVLRDDAGELVLDDQGREQYGIWAQYVGEHDATDLNDVSDAPQVVDYDDE